MLNSGEVPNLFEKDELEQVLAATRPKAKDAGVNEESRDEVCINTRTVLQEAHAIQALKGIAQYDIATCANKQINSELSKLLNWTVA